MTLDEAVDITKVLKVHWLLMPHSIEYNHNDDWIVYARHRVSYEVFGWRSVGAWKRDRLNHMF